MNRQIGQEELRGKIVELIRRHGFREDEDVILNRHTEGGSLSWALYREIRNEDDRGKPLLPAFLEDFERELVIPAKEAWEAEEGRRFFFEVNPEGMTDSDLQMCINVIRGWKSMGMALDRW